MSSLATIRLRTSLCSSANDKKRLVASEKRIEGLKSIKAKLDVTLANFQTARDAINKLSEKFEQKFDLPFRLIADPTHAIMEKYGVWGQKQMFGNKFMGVYRHTFLIDENGVIRKMFLKPKSRTHAEEIVKAWKDLEKASAKRK